jgi:hypothetical protein
MPPNISPGQPTLEKQEPGVPEKIKALKEKIERQSIFVEGMRHAFLSTFGMYPPYRPKLFERDVVKRFEETISKEELTLQGYKTELGMLQDAYYEAGEIISKASQKS